MLVLIGGPHEGAQPDMAWDRDAPPPRIRVGTCPGVATCENQHLEHPHTWYWLPQESTIPEGTTPYRLADLDPEPFDKHGQTWTGRARYVMSGLQLPSEAPKAAAAA